MAYGQVNVDKVVNSDGTITGGLYGFKNRLFNGAMQIDQRNAGASVSTSSGLSVYSVDRWKLYYSQFSKFTGQRSSTAPSGFINSLVATSSSAYTVGASEYFLISQVIEGLTVADLGWGTASASTVTLSFWVRSSLTGTFGGAVGNGAGNRSYPFTYTISAANTWEQKSVTIAGDTSGSWSTDTTAGIALYFSIGSGSSISGTAGSWSGSFYTSATGATSVVGTNGATFYITGVQLEKGAVATTFDYRPYPTELALCQRYCINYSAPQQGSPPNYRYAVGFCNGTASLNTIMALPVAMRSRPSLTTTGTASDYAVYGSWGVQACASVPTISSDSSYQTVSLSFSGTGLTTGQAGQGVANTTASYILLSAEL